MIIYRASFAQSGSRDWFTLIYIIVSIITHTKVDSILVLELVLEFGIGIWSPLLMSGCIPTGPLLANSQYVPLNSSTVPAQRCTNFRHL